MAEVAWSGAADQRRGRRQRRRVAVVVAAVIALGAACGDDPDPQAAGDDPPTAATDEGGSPDEAAVDEEGRPPFCDELEPPGPVAEGELDGMENPDEVLMGVLNTYAHENSDVFGGLWIDRAAGSIVVAVTDDPAPHRAAIAERRPSPDDIAVVEPPPQITETTTVAESGTTVDVVQVGRTEDELRALADEAAELMGDDLGIYVVAVRSSLNRVSLSLKLADPATRAALADVVPVDAVCVEGPEIAPEPIDPDEVDLLAADEDPLVHCRGAEFRLSALDAPADFEESDEPLAEALRAEMDTVRLELGDVVDEGWRVLDRTEEEALLGAGGPPSAFVTMVFERDRWRLGGTSTNWEPCEPRRAVPEGLEEVRWGLDPDHGEPGPEATEVHVLVSPLECAGGEPVGERLIGPQVDVTDDEVVVAFAATPLPRGAYTCPASPPTPVVVTLDEPIGDRIVVDGLDLTPRDAVDTFAP